MSVTPRKSRWSDKVKKSNGTISWVKEFRHFPKGRNLHFADPGVRCILHPELSSKIVITLSTSKNSYMLVIAGFRSSQKAMILYLVSIEGSCAGRSSRWRGRGGSGGGRSGRAWRPPIAGGEEYSRGGGGLWPKRGPWTGRE